MIAVLPNERIIAINEIEFCLKEHPAKSVKSLNSIAMLRYSTIQGLLKFFDRFIMILSIIFQIIIWDDYDNSIINMCDVRRFWKFFMVVNVIS